MMRVWLIAPLLALAALLGSAYGWKTKKDAWQPPAPKVPQLPPLPTLPQPTVPSTKFAVERPLFWSSRRPVPVVDTKKSGLEQELMQSRLMAVFESGAERVAVLRRQDGSVLKITATSTPWRIEVFDGRGAVFVSSDGQRVGRPLEAGNVPPSAGAPVRKP